MQSQLQDGESDRERQRQKHREREKKRQRETEKKEREGGKEKDREGDRVFGCKREAEKQRDNRGMSREFITTVYLEFFFFSNVVSSCLELKKTFDCTLTITERPKIYRRSVLHLHK